MGTHAFGRRSGLLDCGILETEGVCILARPLVRSCLRSLGQERGMRSGNTGPPGGFIPSGAGRPSAPSASQVSVKRSVQVHSAGSSLPLPEAQFKSKACLLTEVVPRAALQQLGWRESGGETEYDGSRLQSRKQFCPVRTCDRSL